MTTVPIKLAIRQHLNIHNVVLVYSRTDPNHPYINSALDEASSAVLIYENEEPAYAVIESSVTITDRDVERTARRASVLTAASGVATEAVVIGTTISDANRERAYENGVTVMLMAK